MNCSVDVMKSVQVVVNRLERNNHNCRQTVTVQEEKAILLEKLGVVGASLIVFL